jgi:hypothetical protein
MTFLYHMDSIPNERNCTLKEDILEPIEMLGLDQFAGSAVIVKARTTTAPIKQWRGGRKFNRFP